MNNYVGGDCMYLKVYIVEKQRAIRFETCVRCDGMQMNLREWQRGICDENARRESSWFDLRKRTSLAMSRREGGIPLP